jgi:pro-apoptotic serine protease NMA111
MRVVVTTKPFYDFKKVEYHTITLDRALCRMELGTQDFNSGQWVFTGIPPCPTSSSIEPQKALIPKPTHEKYPRATYIINALVWVKAFCPLPVHGSQPFFQEAYGLVVNKELGLVLIARDVVLSEFCTTTISIFGSIVIPGEVIFIHPAQNFAVLKYDTSLIEAPIQEAQLSKSEIQPGTSALYFHCNNSWLLDLSPAFVAGHYTQNYIPSISRAARGLNVEVLEVCASSSYAFNGSGLISEDGKVQALWFGKTCTTVAAIVPVLEQLERGETPQTRLLGAQLRSIELLEAGTRGVPEGREIHDYLFLLLMSYSSRMDP